MKVLSKIKGAINFCVIYFKFYMGKIQGNVSYERLLESACKLRNLIAIKFLVRKGVSLHNQNKFEVTPLEVACSSQDVEFAKELIDNGAKVNKRSVKDVSLLDIALKTKNKRLVGLLLNNFAQYSLLNNSENPIIKQLLDNPSLEIQTRLAIEQNDANKLSTVLVAYYDKVHGDVDKMKRYLYGISISLQNIIGGANNLTKIVNDFTINKVGIYSYKLLIEAWKCKNMEAIETLSKNNIDVTRLNEHEDILAVEACKNNDYEALELLLEQGIDINEESVWMGKDNKVYCVNPLIIACLENNEKFVEYLIDSGADVNKNCYNVGTPLEIALKNKNIELTKLLLKNFAKIDLLKEQNGSDKEIFAKIFEDLSGDLDIVIRLIIQNGNLDGFNKCLDLLRYEMILCKYDISKQEKILHNIKKEIKRAKDSNLVEEMLKSLKRFKNNIDLNNSKDEDKSKADLLVEACINHDKVAIDFLLEKGISVNVKDKDGCTPLIAACYRGYKDIVEYLLKIGADPNDRGYVYSQELTKVVCDGTPLVVAIKMRNTDVVNILVKEKKIKINEKIEFGKTALMYAVENDCENIVKTLVENGANINSIPVGGESALITAVCKGNENIVKILLENGADVNYESYNGTALKLAIENKNMSLVKLLIDNFANLDVLDKEREGKNGEFVRNVLESGNIRFFVRSGDCRGFQEQLVYCMQTKSDKYIKYLEEEIKNIDDFCISNNMLNVLNEFCGDKHKIKDSWEKINVIDRMDVNIGRNKQRATLMLT